MDSPVLYRLCSGSGVDSSKALILVSGIFSENSDIKKKYFYAIRHAGWDGEIHHLWWDSSSLSSVLGIGAGVAVVVALPAAGLGVVAKLKNIFHRAKKTGRDHLPGLIHDCLPGKRITFVAHSAGAYMLYKLFKRPQEHPVQNGIDDVILLGGALSKKKSKWRLTSFRTLFNVYSEHDKVLKGWKIVFRAAQIKLPVSPCGRRPIKEKYVSDVVNINLSDNVEDGHSYQEVFTRRILTYSGNRWHAAETSR